MSLSRRPETSWAQPQTQDAFCYGIGYPTLSCHQGQVPDLVLPLGAAKGLDWGEPFWRRKMESTTSVSTGRQPLSRFSHVAEEGALLPK
jgi:hypothetical protein